MVYEGMEILLSERDRRAWKLCKADASGVYPCDGQLDELERRAGAWRRSLEEGGGRREEEGGRKTVGERRKKIQEDEVPPSQTVTEVEGSGALSLLRWMRSGSVFAS